MVQVNSRSVDAKVLKVLLGRYPVTMYDVIDATGLKKQVVERALKGMEARGWVQLERLPDSVFIRLKRSDFTFLGRDETQRKAVKHKSKDRKKKKLKASLLENDGDDMMYA
ncbi:MAG: helix-turn-helix domain-containing protein [Candidatus Thermoplasmatota archaeon]|nr:helix-turn-helix domain-containing protein [Candidatus Thermoplasmatota archaeon]